MSKVLELTGQKFGKLSVIKRVSNDKWDNSRWLCQCDCGNEKIAVGYELKNGHTMSCGCIHPVLSKGKASMRQVINMYKYGAKRRGLKYELTEGQFKEITQQDCYYCGAKPDNKRNIKGYNGAYIYNGVDRIDNRRGYVIGNVVSCCYQCNLSKGKLTQQEFKDWIKKVYKNIQ